MGKSDKTRQNPPTLPQRPADGHKGTFGRVLVVGGCQYMLGAPVLAATAALRCGAGLVELAVPRDLLLPALTMTPELVGLPLPDRAGLPQLLRAANQADALVIGPGMGQGPAAQKRVLALLRLHQPTVVDADALNILAAGKKWPGNLKAQMVLTPHPGEMSRLAELWELGPTPSDDAGRRRLALAVALATGQTVLLKGHRTVVTDGQNLYVNKTGDSTLSKAGSGDVLSGIIGCFLGQRMQPFDAACLGAHIHGLCGQAAGRAMTRRCPLARDLIAMLPAVFASLER